MSKQLDEQLSAFVDGEQDHESDIYAHLQQDEFLRQRWQRYHVISDVIKGHLDDRSFPDLTARISQALDNEPTVLAPRHKVSKLQHWQKQVAGFAVAATVAAVAVVSVQQAKFSESGQVQTIAIQAPANSIKFASVSDDQHRRLDSAVENKLSSYLVQHNEYSAAAKMQGALPYMRIVSITPGKRIDKKPDEK